MYPVLAEQKKELKRPTVSNPHGSVL